MERHAMKMVFKKKHPEMDWQNSPTNLAALATLKQAHQKQW